MALVSATGSVAQVASKPDALSAETAGRFAALALSCLRQEYPNKITHVLNSAARCEAAA
jgi:hypothetical protein